MNTDEQYIISPITKRPVKIGSRLFNQLVKDSLIPGFEPPVRKSKAVAKDMPPPRRIRVSKEEEIAIERKNEITALQAQLDQLMNSDLPEKEIAQPESSDSEDDEIIFF